MLNIRNVDEMQIEQECFKLRIYFKVAVTEMSFVSRGFDIWHYSYRV